jgi:DNA modification methylase
VALRQPTQSQLAIPLLREIHDAGGVARPGELYDRIAARLNLDDATRYDMVDAGKAGLVSAFERRVRWTRQSAVMHDLIEKGDRGVWALTERANAKLQNIVRGTIVTIFETDRGVMLWANAEDAISVIEKGSCQLVFSSPEYPLVKQKIYGNRSSAEWVDWMLRLCEGWRELLTPTGSIMLNVGPTWLPGKAQQSLHVERLLIKLEDELGLSLCQRLDWNSPNRLGALEWVGIRRIRVRSTVEPILWLSPDPNRAFASNRAVLTPYSKSMQRAIDNPHDGIKKRPSGYTFGPSSFVDNGGAIPSSLITASNSDSGSAYRRAERAAGRTPHPATMPEAVSEFCVSLTTEKDDLVYEPFAGSATTPAVCERLERNWIASERSREFIRSAAIRFSSAGIPIRELSHI